MFVTALNQEPANEVESLFGRKLYYNALVKMTPHPTPTSGHVGHRWGFFALLTACCVCATWGLAHFGIFTKQCEALGGDS